MSIRDSPEILSQEILGIILVGRVGVARSRLSFPQGPLPLGHLRQLGPGSVERLRLCADVCAS